MRDAWLIAGHAAIFRTEPDRSVRVAIDGNDIVVRQAVSLGEINERLSVKMRRARCRGDPEIGRRCSICCQNAAVEEAIFARECLDQALGSRTRRWGKVVSQGRT